MIVPAIGGIVPKCFGVMVVKRNAAIVRVMMVSIDTDLRRAVRSFMRRPGRNRHAHAKRQPDQGEQAQQGADAMIHTV